VRRLKFLRTSIGSSEFPHVGCYFLVVPGLLF
jgi:hypothetical protein